MKSRIGFHENMLFDKWNGMKRKISVTRKRIIINFKIVRNVFVKINGRIMQIWLKFVKKSWKWIVLKKNRL